MLVEIGKLSDIPPGEARRFVVDRIEIAVANCDGEYLAVDDICSHAEYSLSDGEVDVDDYTIECPKHGSTFDLHTGRPQDAAGHGARRHLPGQGRGRHAAHRAGGPLT